MITSWRCLISGSQHIVIWQQCPISSCQHTITWQWCSISGSWRMSSNQWSPWSITWQCSPNSGSTCTSPVNCSWCNVSIGQCYSCTVQSLLTMHEQFLLQCKQCCFLLAHHLVRNLGSLQPNTVQRDNVKHTVNIVVSVTSKRKLQLARQSKRIGERVTRTASFIMPQSAMDCWHDNVVLALTIYSCHWQHLSGWDFTMACYKNVIN